MQRQNFLVGPATVVRPDLDLMLSLDLDLVVYLNLDADIFDCVSQRSKYLNTKKRKNWKLQLVRHK